MTDDPPKRYYHRKPPRFDEGARESAIARARRRSATRGSPAQDADAPGTPRGPVAGDLAATPAPERRARQDPPPTRTRPDAVSDGPAVGQPPGRAPPPPSPVSHAVHETPPAPRGHGAMAETPDVEPTTRTHWIVLAAILFVGFLLRLKDPLSTAVIGAEDPYLHMERTWDFLRGAGVKDYPVGFMVLLSPLAAFGPDGFYWAVRFLPPFLGVVAIGGCFLFARAYIHPTAALATAGVIAVMPEHMMRTNILFPTAFDLAVLPFLLWHVVRVTEGHTKSAWWVAGLGVFLLMIHPWFVGMAVVPLGAFALTMVILRSENAARLGAATAGAVFAVFLVLSMLPVWKPTELLFERAVPKFFQIVQQPSAVADLPDHVNYVTMLTWPVIVVGILGVAAALLRRDRFSILALFWVLLLFPITLVDWFGISYIPHRTVVFMAVGLAMLIGIVVAEGIRRMEVAKADAKVIRRSAMAAVAVLLLITIPVAAATPPWYRLYDEDDYAAWEALEANGTAFVVTGSWEARAGYRALTANDASFNPAFFNDEGTRNAVLQQHPDLVVLVGPHAKDVNQDFLQGWRVVGQWGDVTAYANH